MGRYAPLPPMTGGKSLGTSNHHNRNLSDCHVPKENPRMSLSSLLLGRPLATREQGERKIGVFEGLPALGLDGLSSSAYGPEAALAILLPLGAAGLWYIGPIMLGILALLSILYLSYRQTIAAYPVNGGSYTVAKENLGVNASLLAAAALMIDYILTVAVGISAGVAALVSAAPQLHKYTLPLCLGVLVLVTLANLRGTKEAGWAFAFPTYLFITCLAAVLGIGIYKAIVSGGHPQAVTDVPPIPRAAEAASWWLLLCAFASGCTAMTGVEAVSNGVSAFKDPPVQQAHRTLTAIVLILAALLGGIAYLAHAYQVGAMDQSEADYQSVLSQLTGAIVGRGWFYYITIGSVLSVLCLSANTSFVDFPRLCRLVATDGFLPSPFAAMGPRLVFWVGIVFLAAAAGVLLFVFDGITDRLIPLYAVGAFTAFTLSQAGMVMHWRHELRGAGRGGESLAAKDQDRQAVDSPVARPPGRTGNTVRLLVNAVGAAATGAALAIILAAKFIEGAWIVIVTVPAIIALFKLVHRYYRNLNRQLDTYGRLDLRHNKAPVVVLPVKGWDKLAGKSLRFAMRLSNEVIAVHLANLGGDADNDGPERIQNDWAHDVEAPARTAGLKPPKLVVKETPYRAFVEPLLEELDQIEREYPNRLIAVIVPTLVFRHWWEFFLHTRRAANFAQCSRSARGHAHCDHYHALAYSLAPVSRFAPVTFCYTRLKPRRGAPFAFEVLVSEVT